MQIAWRQHVQRTLQRLCKSRNLFLDNSIFITEDKRTNQTITFKNCMYLIEYGTAHSKEALGEMWGEASMSNTDACITIKDFLLWMKGQTITDP